MSLVKVSGNASGTGTFEIAAPNSNTDRTLTLPDASGTVVLDSATQTLANKILSGSMWTSPSGSTITSGTAVASTSGTSINFTGIPSWVKRITVMLSGVSVNSSAIVYMRLGTSSGNAISGYLGASLYINTPAATQASTYLPLDGTPLTPPSTRYGIITVANITGNTWVMSGGLSNSNDTGVSTTNGGIALSGTLDRVAIEVSAGAFDAGSINILYE